jgi:hypothetical protein
MYDAHSANACRPVAVIRTRVTSVVRLPATTHSGCALARPDEIDYLRDNEAVRKQDRFGARPPGTGVFPELRLTRVLVESRFSS